MSLCRRPWKGCEPRATNTTQNNNSKQEHKLKKRTPTQHADTKSNALKLQPKTPTPMRTPKLKQRHQLESQNQLEHEHQLETPTQTLTSTHHSNTKAKRQHQLETPNQNTESKYQIKTPNQNTNTNLKYRLTHQIKHKAQSQNTKTQPPNTNSRPAEQKQLKSHNILRTTRSKE